MRQTSILLATGFLAALAAPADAQTPAWASATAAPVVVDTQMRVVPHAGNLSVLLNSFQVDLQGPNDSLTAVRTVAFQAQLQGVGSATWLRFNQDVRGAVQKDANSRVVIVLDLGTSVQVREYPYGQALNSPIRRTLVSRVRWQPGQRYRGTITVMVERRTPDAVVRVDIDSFDATVARSGAGQ